MKQITKTFLKGLLAVVPITLTLYLLYWLAVAVELVLGDIFKLFLPHRWYLPGLGFVAGVIAVFFVGTFLQTEIIHRIFHRLMSVEGALRFVAAAGIIGHAKQGEPVDPSR